MKRIFAVSVVLSALAFSASCATLPSAPAIELTQKNVRLLNGEWGGTWASGPWQGAATLNLTAAEHSISAQFVLEGVGQDTKRFQAMAVIENGNLVARTKGSITTLTLYQQDRGLALRGTYELLAGRFAGEKGTYEFTKK